MTLEENLRSVSEELNALKEHRADVNDKLRETRALIGDMISDRDALQSELYDIDARLNTLRTVLTTLAEAARP